MKSTFKYSGTIAFNDGTSIQLHHEKIPQDLSVIDINYKNTTLEVHTDKGATMELLEDDALFFVIMLENYNLSVGNYINNTMH